MIRTTFRVLVNTGEDPTAPGAMSEAINVIKCAPAKVAAWPFITRDAQAGFAPEEHFFTKIETVEDEPVDPEETTEEVVTTQEEVAETTEAAPAPRTAFPIGLRASLLHKPLWEERSAEAQTNWNQVLIPQLRTVLSDLQDDLMRAGAWSDAVIEQRPWLGYGALDVVVDPFTICIPVSSTGEFGNVLGCLEQFRALLNAGVLTTDVVRVETATKQYNIVSEEAADPETAANTLGPEFEITEIIDENLWKVFYADGNTQLLDPATGKFVEDE